MNSGNIMAGRSRIILILASILLASNIWLPIWKIELFAPQYPEGLMLLIFANKLDGNVEIINGLNHYIGMQTLHTENFIEFSLLRYIIGFFAGLILLTAILGRRKMVYIVFVVFVLFCVVAMADFYRWNYNYGHNLNPNAAIIVPGMAYQPPLIGYKQLLNFGAYSMPAIGGILFIATGVCMLLVVLMEKNVFARWMKRKSVTMMLLLIGSIYFFTGCSSAGPRPIKINEDSCAYCKMTITEAHFAAQLVTQKGRYYVFDDLMCMVQYVKEDSKAENNHFYIADFCNPLAFIEIGQAYLIQSDSLRSPMNGNLAGFMVKDSAQLYTSRFGAREIVWADLLR